MSSKEKSDQGALGVPLEDLLALLEPTSLEAAFQGDALVARHAQYTVRIQAVPPESEEPEDGPVRAVVRVNATLPQPLREMVRREVAVSTAAFNRYAALGALYAHDDTVEVGSRLTLYEGEDAWRSLQLPLLLFTTLCSAEAVVGAVRRALSGEPSRGGDSEWTQSDLARVEGHLSRMCLCTAEDLGLTAEFGLVEGELSAAAGHGRTALFRLLADQPHPELGGGLFCLLEMPHDLGEEKRVQNVCLQLNSMEMAAHDLPPHFGAWCPGQRGNNPAYVSFLPNALHSASGIAVNTAFWAFHRAQWANALLASLGHGA